MNTHLTGVCINCGRPKEEHVALWGATATRKDYCSAGATDVFHDSGQKALDDNAVELFEAVSELVKLWKDDNEKTMLNIDHAFVKTESILNKIKPSK